MHPFLFMVIRYLYDALRKHIDTSVDSVEDVNHALSRIRAVSEDFKSCSRVDSRVFRMLYISLRHHMQINPSRFLRSVYRDYCEQQVVDIELARHFKHYLTDASVS